MIKVDPLMTSLIEDFVSDKERVFSVMAKHYGPVHIVFPQQIEENIISFSNALVQTGVESSIHLAHKPTKSKSLIKAASGQNIGLDVASLSELNSALSCGFSGDRIECTGPKTRAFLEKAISEGCLISIDSIMELKILSEMKDKKIRILLRIANPECSDRNYLAAESRFGIAKSLLEEAYNLLGANTHLSLEGFHYHNSIGSSDLKAGFTNDLVNIMQDAYRRGFSPTIINIGGFFREPTLADYSEWEKFLELIEQGLVENKEIPTWRNFSYGMYLNERKRVTGREKVQGMFGTDSSKEVISNMLLDTNLTGRALSEIMAENMWTLMLEPGWNLFQQCGITLVEVIGTKRTPSGKNLVLVNANRTNLSTGMKEWFTDPIHISRDENGSNFEGFVVGNLCEEHDFLSKRLFHFDSEPKEGDVLCFVNSAAYSADFEEASPLQQPRGKKFSAVKSSEWEISEE